MKYLPPRQTQNLMLALGLLIIAAAACTNGTNGNNSNSVSPTSPPQKFNFAVIVRDRDNNNLIGQATVLLAVGNETLAQAVTDDYGQAKFSVDSSYYGKSARLYAKHPSYHPADLEILLSTESRMILQLISKTNPKIDPDPPEPAPITGSKPKTTPVAKPTPSLEAIAPGESKTGTIAEQQVIDFRFKADENAPLLFTASASNEPFVEYRIEIYDAQGFPQEGKNMGVRPASQREMPFTPPQTGSYVLRLRGTNRFGTYLVYMKELK